MVGFTTNERLIWCGDTCMMLPYVRLIGFTTNEFDICYCPALDTTLTVCRGSDLLPPRLRELCVIALLHPLYFSLRTGRFRVRGCILYFLNLQNCRIQPWNEVRISENKNSAFCKFGNRDTIGKPFRYRANRLWWWVLGRCALFRTSYRSRLMGRFFCFGCNLGKFSRYWVDELGRCF